VGGPCSRPHCHFHRASSFHKLVQEDPKMIDRASEPLKEDGHAALTVRPPVTQISLEDAGEAQAGVGDPSALASAFLPGAPPVREQPRLNSLVEAVESLSNSDSSSASSRSGNENNRTPGESKYRLLFPEFPPQGSTSASRSSTSSTDSDGSNGARESSNGKKKSTASENSSFLCSSMSKSSSSTNDEEQASRRQRRKRRAKRNRDPNCPVSDHRGVSWHRRDKKWLARTWIRGRIEHLGCYKEEKQAALAVDLRTVEVFGTNPKKELNYPDPVHRERLLAEFQKDPTFKIKRSAELDGPGNYNKRRKTSSYGVPSDEFTMESMRMTAQHPPIAYMGMQGFPAHFNPLISAAFAYPFSTAVHGNLFQGFPVFHPGTFPQQHTDKHKYQSANFHTQATQYGHLQPLVQHQPPTEHHQRREHGVNTF